MPRAEGSVLVYIATVKPTAMVHQFKKDSRRKDTSLMAWLTVEGLKIFNGNDW